MEKKGFKKTKEHLNLLVNLLKKGNGIKFFEVWNQIAEDEKKEDPEVLKLSLMLHAYFFVMNHKHTVRNKNQYKVEVNEVGDSRKETDSVADILYRTYPDLEDNFRTLLVTNAKYISYQPALLPYFTLPFVPDPQELPVYNEILEDSWCDGLELELTNWFHSAQEECAKCSSALDESECCQYFFKYCELKKKFNRLRKEHVALLDVVIEMEKALESSVLGNPVDLKLLWENCAAIFPGLFANPFEGETKPKDAKKDNGVNFADLDWGKILNHLTHGSIKNKLLLAQALRWALTKRNAESSRMAAEWIVRMDIVGSLKEWLTEPHPLQQTAARLINALASLPYSGPYLAKYIPILAQIIASSDPVTRDMTVAALQKLSTRRSWCEKMLELDVLGWLLIKIVTDVSPYFLEYGSSLLANLCRAEAPCRFQSDPLPITAAIVRLIAKESTEEILKNGLSVAFHVAPCKRVKEELQKNGIEELLRNRMSDISELTKEKLVALIHFYSHPGEMIPSPIWLQDSQMNNYFVGGFETEIDEKDFIKGNPNGDALLREHYRRLFPTPSVVDKFNNQVHLSDSLDKT